MPRCKPAIRKSFKFRLYPNRTQTKALQAMQETLRHLWNECLGWRTFAWEELRVSISERDQAKWWTHARKRNPWYAKVGSSVGRGVIYRLQLAFDRFFSNCENGIEPPGYPRMKAKNDAWSVSIPFPRGPRDGCKIRDGKLSVMNVGMVRIRQHREIQGTIKGATIKCEAGDKWFVIFSCELGPIPQPFNNGGPQVGLDMGLTKFVTTSDGEMIENPRAYVSRLEQVRRLNQSVSAKRNGSNNRRKAKLKLARLHAKIANIRSTLAHQLSTTLVRRFSLIGVEKLDVRGMITKLDLKKQFSDAGWGMFRSFLQAKALASGCEVIAVDPRNTTQLCSGCQTLVPKGLHDRQHVCPRCGLDINRDVNAARNILQRALAQRRQAGGDACEDVEPGAKPASFKSQETTQVNAGGGVATDALLMSVGSPVTPTVGSTMGYVSPC